jgi:hypothetical protein
VDCQGGRQRRPSEPVILKPCREERTLDEREIAPFEVLPALGHYELFVAQVFDNGLNWSAKALQRF